VALGSELGAIRIVGSFTVSASAALLALKGPVPPLLSVAVTVKVKVPPAVGVPARLPLLASVMPAGRLPEVTA